MRRLRGLGDTKGDGTAPRIPGVVRAPFSEWALASMLLGLGFTFCSGAVEASLVDALTATGYAGSMESVFGRGQMVTGAAMLTGSVAGGFIAQQTSLGAPFVLRGAVLIVMFAVAFRPMHDGSARS